jgi:alpha-beta hydrolase superfamily lysophospholipase
MPPLPPDASATAASTTLRTADGATLAVLDWPADVGTPAGAPAATRGTLLIAHGLGEHARRYAPLAAQLNARGWSVRAYDLYGHGRSSGPRGGLARETQHLEHLAEVAAATRTAGGRAAAPTGSATGPLVVLGHSMGGLVASSAVARGLLAPDALVLSSPALAVDMAAWQRAAVGWLPRIAPGLTLGNGLQTKYLSHDAAVVAAYESDPLVHDRICARLGAFVASEGERVIAAAARWRVPTLLLYAGDDRLVAPRGSEAFASAAAAGGAPVRAQRFDALYHEIFNETDPAPVKALASWLDTLG